MARTDASFGEPASAGTPVARHSIWQKRDLSVALIDKRGGPGEGNSYGATPA